MFFGLAPFCAVGESFRRHMKHPSTSSATDTPSTHHTVAYHSCTGTNVRVLQVTSCVREARGSSGGTAEGATAAPAGSRQHRVGELHAQQRVAAT